VEDGRGGVGADGKIPGDAGAGRGAGGVEGKELGRVGSGRSGSEAVKLEREVRGRACVV
jgi:hypothetical protein